MKTSIATLADQVLEQVRGERRVKQAEAETIKEASEMTPTSELGGLLRKLAADIKNQEVDITLDDLNDFLYGGGHHA